MPTLIKDIPLTGLSTSPSDYEIQDGNLAAAIGVVHEGGTLSNASFSSPKKLKDFGVERVLYLHETFDKKNLICSNGENVCWKQMADDQSITDGSNLDYIDMDDVRNVISIGNTLIIYTDTKPYYFLWSKDNYSFLGNKLPEANIEFGLEGETKIYYYKTQETIDNNTNYAKDAESIIKLGDDVGMKLTWKNFDSVPEHVKTLVTEGVMSRVNKFVSEECDGKGRFCMPFLVRYAYRLFDGTLTMHSAPVLMIPDTDAPIVPIHGVIPDDDSIYFHVIGTSSELNYKVNNYSALKEELEKWKDIITSIEVYVSEPFYTYDQSGTVDRVIKDGVTIMTSETEATKIWIQSNAVQNTYWNSKVKEKYAVMAMHDFNEKKNTTEWESNFDATSNNPYRKSINSFFKDNNMTDDYDSGYMSGRCDQYVRLVKQPDGSYYVSVGDSWDADCVFRDDKDIFKNPCFLFYHLPEREWPKIENDAKECSNFYFIKEIRADEIKESREIIRLDGGELRSLSSRTPMTDDYDSHDDKIAKVFASYNSRLNMADVSITKYDGYDMKAATCRVNGDFTSCIYFVEISNDYGRFVVRNESQLTSTSGQDMLNYFYYPDPKARTATFFFGSNNVYTRKVVLKLREHKGLNGAVSNVSLKPAEYVEVSMSKDDVYAFAADSLGYTGNASYTMKNELYTSEVNNPFNFKANNIESIGGGEIIALVPAAISMSQGQFGQFPMYAFTTDGIWSLSVSDTGGWSSKQPFSRDVPINGADNKPLILQLDQDIIFATYRGLMQLSGSQLQCISEIFDGSTDQFFDKYDKHMKYILDGNKLSDISYSEDLFVPFMEFLRGGNMSYDYTHQRIIVSNPSFKFCFIFNMKDKLWTAEVMNVTSVVNSYPESYAMVKEGTKNILIDFTKHDSDVNNIYMPSDGYILTRPLKLDEPDTLKTIRSVIVRGTFDRSHVSTIIYGSRDLYNWQLVGSVSGNRFVSHHGTPYKYFRVAVISKLIKNESVSGITIEFETKQTDKLR